MKILALESSSLAAAAAVMDDDRLLGEYILNHTQTHSQKLMPMVEELLEAVGITPADIDLFAVSKGPGSFTGLRIGIASIKALAQAVQKPVVGIPTLDALAFNLAGSMGLICPIMDARRDQVYTSVYRWQNGGSKTVTEGQLKRLDEYMAIHIEDLTRKLEAMGEPVLFNGDGVAVYKEFIKERMAGKAQFAPPTVRLQRASSVAWLANKEAAAGRVQSHMELKPFYLRKSQAEQKFGDN